MTDPRSSQVLLARRALAEKATPGPWAYGLYRDTDTYGVGVVLDENDEPVSGLDKDRTQFVAEPVAPEVLHSFNAAHIAAHDPTTVMADIDEILHLRETVERLEKEADWLAEKITIFCNDYRHCDECPCERYCPDGPLQVEDWRDVAHDIVKNAVKKSEKDSMNNARRKRIDEAMKHLSLARELLETVRDEEQEAYDNLPENLQEGERGQKMEEAVDTLDTAVSDLENVESSLEECKE